MPSFGYDVLETEGEGKVEKDEGEGKVEKEGEGKVEEKEKEGEGKVEEEGVRKEGEGKKVEEKEGEGKVEEKEGMDGRCHATFCFLTTNPSELGIWGFAALLLNQKIVVGMANTKL